MKVICIDDKLRDGEYDTGKNVKEGESYTVTETKLGFDKNLVGIPCYRLAEISKADNPNNLFAQDRFIPISQIDETQMERNYSKELV